MNAQIPLSMLAALLVLAVSAPASAQEATPRPRKTIVYEPRPASDFAFLVPGKTTIEEASKTLGDTKWAYLSYLVENDVALYLSLANLPALYRYAGDRPVVAVEVRVYTAGPEGTGAAYLVFKEGVLFYAHHPVPASESRRAGIEARWGKKLEVYTELPDPGVEKVLYSTHLLRVPGESVAYLEDRDSPRIEMKILLAPEARITGYTRGDISKRAKP